MVPLVADWFQSDSFFKTVEYTLPVQDNVKQFSVFVLKPCINNNQAGLKFSSHNFMIFCWSYNNSTLVNFHPCDSVVICDFMSRYVPHYLHSVYTDSFQVSLVAFSAISLFFTIIIYYDMPLKTLFPLYPVLVPELPYNVAHPGYHTSRENHGHISIWFLHTSAKFSFPPFLTMNLMPTGIHFAPLPIISLPLIILIW